MNPLGTRVLGLVALACASLLASTALADRLPVEYFVKHDDYRDVSISPDGRKLAVTFVRDDRVNLAFIDLATMRPIAGVEAYQDSDVLTFRWVNDRRVVYTIGQRSDYFAAPGATGELWAVDFDGGRHLHIFGYRGLDRPTGSRVRTGDQTFADHSILSILPDDDDHILIAEYPLRQTSSGYQFDSAALPTVSRLNVNNGRKRRIERVTLPGAQLLLDREHNVRFALGTGSDFETVAWYRPRPNSDWETFQVEGLARGELTPVSFSPDNRKVYLVARPEDGLTTSALFALDLETHGLEKLFQHETVDILSTITDPVERKLVGVAVMPDTVDFHYLDLENPTVRLHRGLRASFEGEVPTIVSASRDGNRSVVRVTSDRNPGQYYLMDRSNNSAAMLLSRRSWVDPALMRPMTPISLEARDGLTLHGYVTVPVGEGPHPMVVLPHGGPHGPRDMWGYDIEAQLFAHHGYAVLQVNFRGSGGYGQAFLEAGYKEWGAKMQDDVTDATLWAVAQGYADPGRICIYGGSYGGYAALMGVAKEPDLYRCAAGIVGAYDLSYMSARGNVAQRLHFGPAYLERAIGTDPDTLRERSPVNHAAKIKVPVFLAHGGEDSQVPVANAERMRAALEQHGKTPEWLVYQNEGHGFYKLEHRIEFYGRLLDFLQRNL